MSLITVNDIKDIKQISDNLQPEKIIPFIDEAGELNIKPEMGPALYKAFKDSIASTTATAIYDTLMDGEAYVCGNDTIDFPGVKPAIAYYAYSRYLSEQDTISTVGGLVTPISNHSERISEKSLQRKIGQARSAASHYIDEMHRYLSEKSASYPLYKGDGRKRKSGKIRITSVG